MPLVGNINSLKKKIATLAKRYGDKPNPAVVVGYTQNYALFVHENKQAHHRVGQAKFLEQPAREKQKDIAQVVEDVTMRSLSLEKGLLTGGMRLQREAQLLTPVDTSALKASAFTDLEENLEAASSKAYNYSQALKAGKNAYRERKRHEKWEAKKAAKSHKRGRKR